MIEWNDFEKIDIRTGTITDVQDFPKARKPSYQLTIDFGPLGIKRSSAQITHHYTKEDLLNKQVVAVVNSTFPDGVSIEMIGHFRIVRKYCPCTKQTAQEIDMLSIYSLLAALQAPT